MKKGFTLIELALVITLLGILVLTGLPKFDNFITKTREKTLASVIGTINAGISLYRANEVVKNGPPGNYPANLDELPAGTICKRTTPCFDKVLSGGSTDKRWIKSILNSYIYDDGDNPTTYIYVPAEGRFKRL